MQMSSSFCPFGVVFLLKLCNMGVFEIGWKNKYRRKNVGKRKRRCMWKNTDFDRKLQEAALRKSDQQPIVIIDGKKGGQALDDTSVPPEYRVKEAAWGIVLHKTV